MYESKAISALAYAIALSIPDLETGTKNKKTPVGKEERSQFISTASAPPTVQPKPVSCGCSVNCKCGCLGGINPCNCPRVEKSLPKNNWNWDETTKTWWRYADNVNENNFISGSPIPYVGSSVPYVGSSAPYVGSSVPYVGSSAPYVGSSVPYVGSSNCGS
jgi:hypothetical protein